MNERSLSQEVPFTDTNTKPSLIISPARAWSHTSSSRDFEEKALFQHAGEELLYVLEGTHEFTYDGKKYVMHEGDCVYFDSGVPHTGKSLGREKARLLAVMYPHERPDGESVVS